MKINETNRIGGVNPYQKQKDARVGASDKAKQKDEVQISAAAKELLTTSKASGADRIKHIEELKNAVTSGTYHVEAGKIAEKLLPYLGKKQSE
ncbi:negative regulator of flagellin synthesis FlgM [Paenibacillus endophyticus]|uniref:Negative regulator of flagellin synthesis n=1 Tax=Paenibacillus endophyticus TaxID=1294268 RepID=A0A7W5CBF8_9BACL|nr:flagellar biosynthesis anti-sigma factor FlgM [Paenibacillus endophyticus]MBB3154626.1 negative regulator of flagellin synthesis FlgM [Paenibacillus endophyticus]